jgi:hypothetical protein
VNLYVVDGVNITNQGFGALGSYSIVVGSLGNGTPYDFIKEVEVKTGGFESEFGQTTGGVVNLITKSGSNAMRGSVFGYTRPGGLESAFTEVQTRFRRRTALNTTGPTVSRRAKAITSPRPAHHSRECCQVNAAVIGECGGRLEGERYAREARREHLVLQAGAGNTGSRACFVAPAWPLLRLASIQA